MSQNEATYPSETIEPWRPSVFGTEGAMELCMLEKAVFFLPVNVLTVWLSAFLAAQHITVCLDFNNVHVCVRIQPYLPFPTILFGDLFILLIITTT